jgi:hypothetical protein
MNMLENKEMRTDRNRIINDDLLGKQLELDYMSSKYLEIRCLISRIKEH